MSARFFTFITWMAFLFSAAGISAQETIVQALVMMQQPGIKSLYHPDGGISAWKNLVEKTEES